MAFHLRSASASSFKEEAKATIFGEEINRTNKTKDLREHTFSKDDDPILSLCVGIVMHGGYIEFRGFNNSASQLHARHLSLFLLHFPGNVP